MAQKKSLPPGQKDTPPTERIATSFKQLAGSAKEIHSAADELCTNIAPLNHALAKLGLGVAAWHQFAGHEDRDGSYWSRDIGYTKIGAEWCIALRRTSGHNGYDHYDEEVWAFKDAPRWIQIESVGKLPDLLDELIKRTDDTVKKLRAKAVLAKELADALNVALAEISAAQR